MWRRAAGLVILLGLLWFAALGFRQFDRPGLNYEECSFVPPLIGGPPFETRPSPDLKSLLMRPFINPMGTSPARLRSPLVALGLLALLLGARFAWRHFGPRQSALFALLATLDPSVLHHVREDYARAAFALPLRTGVLLAFFAFLRGGRTRALLVAAFLAGVGVWNQADFLLFVVALAVATTVCRRDVFRERRWWAALPAFLAGASPALVFWARHHELVALTWSASPPLSFAGLGYKLLAIGDTLRAHYPTYTFLGQGSITPPHTLLPELLITGLLALIWLRRRRVKHELDSALSLLAVLFLVHAGLLWLSPWTFGSHHFFALAPTVHLLAAALVVHFLDHAFISPSARRVATPLLLAPILITSIISSWRAERLLDQRGGDGPWSPAIYQLAAETKKANSDLIVFLDGGMTTQLLTLNGRFPQLEAYRSLVVEPASAGAVRQIERLISFADGTAQTTDMLFVTHAAEHLLFPQATKLFDELLAAGNNQRQTPLAIVDQRGLPQYELFRIGKSAPSVP